MPTNNPETATDDETERPTAHQQAIDCCQHAIDALQAGDLTHARALLADAEVAIDDAAAETPTQTYRETGWDCYD